jgi:hypothetical protein
VQLKLSFRCRLDADLVEAYEKAFPAVCASALAYYLSDAGAEERPSAASARAKLAPDGLHDVACDLCLYFDEAVDRNRRGDALREITRRVAGAAHTMTVLRVNPRMPEILKEAWEAMAKEEAIAVSRRAAEV